MIEPDLARGFVEELSRAAAEPRLPATVPPNAAPFDVVLHALHVAGGAAAIGMESVRLEKRNKKQAKRAFLERFADLTAAVVSNSTAHDLTPSEVEGAAR